MLRLLRVTNPTPKSLVWDPTPNPTHQPRQDDRERPCHAGMLQAGPPPNLAPASLAQPLQTQFFFQHTTAWRVVTCDFLNSGLCACTQFLSALLLSRSSNLPDRNLGSGLWQPSSGRSHADFASIFRDLARPTPRIENLGVLSHTKVFGVGFETRLEGRDVDFPRKPAILAD